MCRRCLPYQKGPHWFQPNGVSVLQLLLGGFDCSNSLIRPRMFIKQTPLIFKDLAALAIWPCFLCNALYTVVYWSSDCWRNLDKTERKKSLPFLAPTMKYILFYIVHIELAKPVCNLILARGILLFLWTLKNCHSPTSQLV